MEYGKGSLGFGIRGLDDRRPAGNFALHQRGERLLAGRTGEEGNGAHASKKSARSYRTAIMFSCMVANTTKQIGGTAPMHAPPIGVTRVAKGHSYGPIQGSGHARMICSIIFDCWRGNGIKFSMLSTARHENSPRRCAIKTSGSKPG